MQEVSVIAAKKSSNCNGSENRSVGAWLLTIRLCLGQTMVGSTSVVGGGTNGTEQIGAAVSLHKLLMPRSLPSKTNNRCLPSPTTRFCPLLSTTPIFTCSGLKPLCRLHRILMLNPICRPHRILMLKPICRWKSIKHSSDKPFFVLS